MLGPARVQSTGWVGIRQAMMDGVPHCLGRMTPSVCPAGSLGMTLWGEILLSTVEISFMTCFYGQLSLSHSPAGVSWNQVPQRRFLKLLSVVLFLGKLKLRQQNKNGKAMAMSSGSGLGYLRWQVQGVEGRGGPSRTERDRQTQVGGPQAETHTAQPQMSHRYARQTA